MSADERASRVETKALRSGRVGRKNLCKQVKILSRCYFEASKMNKYYNKYSSSEEAWTMEAGIASEIGLFA